MSTDVRLLCAVWIMAGLLIVRPWLERRCTEWFLRRATRRRRSSWAAGEALRLEEYNRVQIFIAGSREEAEWKAAVYAFQRERPVVVKDQQLGGMWELAEFEARTPSVPKPEHWPPC